MNIGLKPSRLLARSYKTYLFYLSALVFFATVTEILDVFELPFESLAAQVFTSGSLVSTGLVTATLSSSGYLGIFALMTLESASIPIPSEVVLPFAGYLVFVGDLNFAGVLAASTAAGTAGALADYFLAARLGRPLLKWLFAFSSAGQANMSRAERWISDKGAWALLAARFIPGLRSVISVPAGALRMRLRAFVPITAVGALGWSALLVYLGYASGRLWQGALAQESPALVTLILLAGAAASLSHMVYYVASASRTGHSP